MLDVLDNLYDLLTILSDLAFTFSFHLLECLRTILEKVHLEEVVLLEFLLVFPEGFFVDGGLSVAVGVRGVQINVRSIEIVADLSVNFTGLRTCFSSFDFHYSFMVICSFLE